MWDPASGETFGEYARRKNLQVRPVGWTWRTRDQVSTGRREDGVPFERRVDQLGNETREHSDGRRDAIINLAI
ncbi:hypothetical protein [Nonomuraea sp. bgisy101]|uniref:hypothetical protein n=1 Tax=Nonomuraea sp. bgisy101 TaxID=3413784 RepID=UPI003D744F51